MKNKLLILASSLLFSAAVFAGYSQPFPVEIVADANGGYAQGDMASARYSDNENELIGCGMRAFDDGVGGVTYWGFCQARLDEETGYTCFTDNPALLEGINIISDHSFVTFSWADDGEGNLTCTRIGSSTQSFYLPVAKDTKK